MSSLNVRWQFRAMGCHSDMTVVADSPRQAEAAMASAVAEVQRIERKFSRYRPDSKLSRINASAGSGHTVACDAETNWLLDATDALHQQSDGLFDITSGVLRRAWDFQRHIRPTTAQLAALLPLIGWHRVERSAAGVRLPIAGMELDWGGLAKEYAADRAAQVLREQGVHRGYVNLGGDIAVIGPQADGTPWRIGIRHPRAPGRPMASVLMAQGGLATSGDYERFFDDPQGQRHCHILNPRTGQSCRYWQSVSVVAPLCYMAGAHATIAMLKERQGLAFLQATGHAHLVVDPLGHLTHGLDATHPSTPSINC